MPVPADVVKSQLEAVLSDLDVKAIKIGQIPSVLWPVIERKNGMIAPENFVITIVENAVATPCDIFGRVCEGKIPFAESGSRFCCGGFGRNESKKVA